MKNSVRGPNRRTLSQKEEEIMGSKGLNMKGSYTPSFFSSRAQISSDVNDALTKVLEELIIHAEIYQKDLLFSSQSDDPNEFKATTLHSKCDNKGPILIIAELENGIKVGAYTACGWISAHSNESYKDDKCAIFDINKDKVMIHGLISSEVYVVEDGFGFGRHGEELAFSFKSGSLVKYLFLNNNPDTFDSLTETTAKAKKISVYSITM